MKVVRLETMVRGWFIGDFEPSLRRTRDVEVGVQQYVPGSMSGHIIIRSRPNTL